MSEIKPGANSVLFQARRYEQHDDAGGPLWSCPLSRNTEYFFDNVAGLLKHAQDFHPEVASHHTDSTNWKIYLLEASRRARRRRGANNSLPQYAFPQKSQDGHIRPAGIHFPENPAYPHPSPSRVASNLNDLSLNNKFVGPNRNQFQAQAQAQTQALAQAQAQAQLQSQSRFQSHASSIPSKRPAASGQSRPPSQDHQRMTQVDGRSVQKRSHGSGLPRNQNTRTYSNAFVAEESDHERNTEGRKQRRLSKHDRKHSAHNGGEALNVERCMECSRRGQRCEKDANDDSCRTCLAEDLDCKPMDRQSNRAQAPHSAGDGDASSVSSAISNESIPESVTDTLDGESGPAQYDDSRIEVLLQPQTKPITLQQLEVEVNTIQKAVEAFEANCRDEYAIKLAAARLPIVDQPVMEKEDYQRYIGRHKSFMQETHDLCLATQHPVSSVELRALPRKINVPARMWQYGIAAPLEILRMLPEAREHAVAFILIAFNMMTLFLETVPDFEGTWLECIGDLARYRLGLAETDEEKEVFSAIATYWFRRALELNPQIGRLRHHLAVLVPNFSVEQLSLYGHSLTAYMPFFAARKSALASWRPVLDEGEQLHRRVPAMSLAFLRAHASLFIGGPGSLAYFNSCVRQLNDYLFEEFVQSAAKEKAGLKKFGCHVAISNSAALYEYGATTESNHDRSILRYAFLTRHAARAQVLQTPSAHPDDGSRRKPLVPGGNDVLSRLTISHACTMTFGMLSVALRRPKDENLHPMIHISFVMIWAFCGVSMAIEEVESRIPWKDMVSFLNAFANVLTMKNEICSTLFPHNEPARGQALPEDFMIQGLWFSQDYFPPRWCENSNMDQQERLIEKESYLGPRIERILWLGYGVAAHKKWITYDKDSKSFVCNAQSSRTQVYLTEPELQPLYQPDHQTAIPNWNTQPSLRSASDVSEQDKPRNQRLHALSQKWVQFKPQCETFLSNPPSKKEITVQQQRSLGEKIAQEFLAELDSIRPEEGGGGNTNQNSSNSSNNRQFNINTSSSGEKDILKQDMQAMIRRINQLGKNKRNTGRFRIYSDDG